MMIRRLFAVMAISMPLCLSAMAESQTSPLSREELFALERKEGNTQWLEVHPDHAKMLYDSVASTKNGIVTVTQVLVWLSLVLACGGVLLATILHRMSTVAARMRKTSGQPSFTTTLDGASKRQRALLSRLRHLRVSHQQHP